MQRLRLLLAAAAIALLSLVGFSHAASAETAPHFNNKADKECYENYLAKGKDVEDCQKSPNPLLPETNELLWGGIGFIIVFGFLWKMGYPSIKAGMDARTQRIQGDLDAAEAQRTEAASILTQYQAQLADARAESARIIEEARQSADEVKASLVEKANADVAEMRAKAAADIEAAKAQAVADLRGEVTSLALGAAEQVIGHSLDRDTNVALVEAYIDSVGATR